MDNLFNSIDKLAECQNKVDGEINIILPQLFATQFVHPYLAQFVNKYPNLRLNLSYPIVDISVFDTTAYDFAITSIRPSNLNLIIKVFHRSEIALYAAPSYLADHPLPIFEPADLIHHSAIIPRINMQFLYTWQLINQQTQQIETVMLESQCSISTNNFFANLSLAKAGVGICPLIDYIAQPALASGELIRVLSNYTFQEGDECYLVRPNNLKNYRAELFLKFLTSCIDHPPKQ